MLQSGGGAPRRSRSGHASGALRKAERLAQGADRQIGLHGRNSTGHPAAAESSLGHTAKARRARGTGWFFRSLTAPGSPAGRQAVSPDRFGRAECARSAEATSTSSSWSAAVRDALDGEAGLAAVTRRAASMLSPNVVSRSIVAFHSASCATRRRTRTASPARGRRPRRSGEHAEGDLTHEQWARRPPAGRRPRPGYRTR